jgi:uncharacterized protein YegL
MGGFAAFSSRDFEQFTVKSDLVAVATMAFKDLTVGGGRFLGSLEIKREQVQTHAVSAIRAVSYGLIA